MSPLVRKLGTFTPLTEEDAAGLDGLCASVQLFRAGEPLISEGDKPDHVHLLLDGWACRSKTLADGRRQTLAYLVPGDLCDIHVFILDRMDHTISAVSDARVAVIPQPAMQEVLHHRPAVAQALFWSTLVDEAILREWLVNLTRRNAFERMAHLFCELRLRLGIVGLATDEGFALPLTQEQLGEATGLTAVHVNRVLQRMRREELISLAGRRLAIHDIARLYAAARFDPNYLHLRAAKEAATPSLPALA